MKIVDAAGRVRPGAYSGPVEFNYTDYRMPDFFGREVRGLRKKLRFHRFHYMAMLSGPWTLGVALVDLGFAKSGFVFLQHRDRGRVLTREWSGPGFSSALTLPPRPEPYQARIKGRKTLLEIERRDDEIRLMVDASPRRKEPGLRMEAVIPFTEETHRPWKILSPSSPSCWTFTEKAAGLTPREISFQLQGGEIPEAAERDEAREMPRRENTAFLFDWSGGYLRRETNWYWASLGGINPGVRPGGERLLGANLAALVNESFVSENALWWTDPLKGAAPAELWQVPRHRRTPNRVIFTMDTRDFYRPWRIVDEAGTLALTFTPKGEFSQRLNAGLVKNAFRQFSGTFTGHILLEDPSRPPPGEAHRESPSRGKGEPVEIKELPGVCEHHRALW